ncbi:MAG: hypothetical protein ACRDOO_10945 [Actinomadura sp.]
MFMHYFARLGAVLVFGVAVLFSVAAAPSPSPKPTPGPTSPGAKACPSVCMMIYQPVRCLFTNGATLAFGNMCQAQAYACDRRLQILACVPRNTASAAGPAA